MAKERKDLIKEIKTSKRTRNSLKLVCSRKEFQCYFINNKKYVKSDDFQRFERYSALFSNSKFFNIAPRNGRQGDRIKLSSKDIRNVLMKVYKVENKNYLSDRKLKEIYIYTFNQVKKGSFKLNHFAKIESYREVLKISSSVNASFEDIKDYIDTVLKKVEMIETNEDSKMLDAISKDLKTLEYNINKMLNIKM